MLTQGTLAAAVGTELGTSEWTTVSQDQINAFADLTEDWQPIHIEQAAAQDAGFDSTVAHGFLTLSLLSKMSYEVLPKLEGETASLNYGFDRIRFLAPVSAGARIRGHFVLSDAQPRGPGWMLRFSVTVETEGHSKPALTADCFGLYLF